MKQDDSLTIVGSGIVGLCIALTAARAGLRVTVIDPLDPGRGASFGNGGMISVDAYAPMALPGMLRQVPSWLRDPLGPLAVRPRYALPVAPWLVKWIRASNIERARRSARALNALHRPALDLYGEMLGPADFSSLIRVGGSLQIWEGAGPGRSELTRARLRQELDVEVRPVSGDECREIAPGLSPKVDRGLHFPRNGHTVNPGRLTATLAETIARAGGTFRREKVLSLEPRAGGGFTVWTNEGTRAVGRVVLAAGAWTAGLLKPLGLALPLEAERGYHLSVTSSLSLPMPVLHQGRGFGMTPMEEGIRLGGTVELAGLEAAPDPRRSLILRRLAAELFPGMESQVTRSWMGFRPSLPDSVPAVGPVPGVAGLHVAVGHGHYGMIGAPATAKLLLDLIGGAAPAIDPAPYSLARFGKARPPAKWEEYEGTVQK